MAYKVVWPPVAEADIAEIGNYLEKVASPAIAASVITAMRAAAFRTCDFPFAARMIPEFQDPTRRETLV